MKKIFYIIYLLVITTLLTELGLRILRYREYRQQTYRIESQPSFCFLADSLLGFRLKGGSFEINLNGELTFHTTHNQNGQRITSNQPKDSWLCRIDIHGCSYTYGYGLDDSLSLPFLLQGELANMNVQSYAVPGYGLVQSLLILRQQIESGDLPDRVILNYVSLHDERHSLSTQFRQDLYRGFARASAEVQPLYRKFRYPYVELAADTLVEKSCPWDSLYEDFWGRETFACINLLQSSMDSWNEAGIEKEEISYQLIRKISELCIMHGVELIVFGLDEDDRTEQLLGRLSESGITAEYIGLPLTDPHWHLYPYDTHPNASAHRFWSGVILQKLGFDIPFRLSSPSKGTGRFNHFRREC